MVEFKKDIAAEFHFDEKVSQLTYLIILILVLMPLYHHYLQNPYHQAMAIVYVAYEEIIP